MADRRWKNGIFVGNPQRKKIIDNPINHGWAKLRISDIDGCQIFCLGPDAEMKMNLSKPGDWIARLKVKDEWLVFEFGGTLTDITNFVERTVFIPFEGEPICPEPMSQVEEYGLEPK